MYIVGYVFLRAFFVNGDLVWRVESNCQTTSPEPAIGLPGRTSLAVRMNSVGGIWPVKAAIHKTTEIATLLLVGIKEESHALAPSVGSSMNPLPVLSAMIMVVNDGVRKLEKVLFFIIDALEIANEALAT